MSLSGRPSEQTQLTLALALFSLFKIQQRNSASETLSRTPDSRCRSPLDFETFPDLQLCGPFLKEQARPKSASFRVVCSPLCCTCECWDEINFEVDVVVLTS